jgi:hypothetical protein
VLIPCSPRGKRLLFRPGEARSLALIPRYATHMHLFFYLLLLMWMLLGLFLTTTVRVGNSFVTCSFFPLSTHHQFQRAGPLSSVSAILEGFSHVLLLGSSQLPPLIRIGHHPLQPASQLYQQYAASTYYCCTSSSSSRLPQITFFKKNSPQISHRLSVSNCQLS